MNPWLILPYGLALFWGIYLACWVYVEWRGTK